MSRDVSESPPAPTLEAGRWHEWLVLGGGVAFVAGLVHDRTWREVQEPDRLFEACVLLAMALLPALILRAWRGWPLADGLLVAMSVALAVFAGPLPMLATLLLALAAMAAGGLATRGPAALPVGLALIAGLAGWLLPLPIHAQWTHALVLAALVAWRRHDIVAGCARLLAGWRSARDAAPVASCLAMLVMLLASTGAWLPTMQYDDLAYHLGLPFQLQHEGAYALDPTHQIWALAPWAGDVLHGIAQVVADREARGAVDALWLGIAAAGVHRLSGLFGASAWARWAAVALFASLPLTLSLTAGMQTELPGAAVLLWLACVIADRPRRGGRGLLAGAILFGLLWALKLMHAAVAIPLLAWAAWRHRERLRGVLADGGARARILLAALAVPVVGGASYCYAAVIAGNPVLPLMNGTFRSPYFPPLDFVDGHWRHGFEAALPWHITFDTHRYFEGVDGAFGFVLVAAVGAWILALLQPRTRAFALAATAGMALAAVPVQYARYLYPSLVLLLPVLVVALDKAVPRTRAALLVAGLCLAQVAVHGHGYWMLSTDAVRDTVLAAGADEPLLERFAPERLLLARLRASTQADGPVLALGTNPDAFAELGARGRTASWYAPRFNDAAMQADGDATGRAWAALLQREGVRHVLLRDEMLHPAQRAGLARVGARRVDTAGNAEWWQLPEPTP